MVLKPGVTVIVTENGSHQVGVILDRYMLNKQLVFDVLLETRSAKIMLSTTTSKNIHINKMLSEKLCESGLIQTTIPYKTLLENNDLPICHS
jgi:hypothetical protein